MFAEVLFNFRLVTKNFVLFVSLLLLTCFETLQYETWTLITLSYCKAHSFVILGLFYGAAGYQGPHKRRRTTTDGQQKKLLCIKVTFVLIVV